MTLSRAVRVGGLIIVTLLAFIAVFQGNQRHVFAAVNPILGTDIVCKVYTRLDAQGNPLPHLLPNGCAPTPPIGQATIKIVKQVSGGTAAPSDFSIHIMANGSEVSGSPQPGSLSGTIYTGFSPGTYPVSETGGPSGYTATYSGACDSSGNVQVAASDIATCTITNTYGAPPTPPENTLALCTDGIDNDADGKVDLADPDCAAFMPKLTIVKHTKDITGAFGLSASFSFKVLAGSGGNQVASTTVSTVSGYGTSTPIQIPAGASTLTENQKFGWDLTDLSCVSTGASVSTSLPGGATITAHAGDSITCTFTNTVNGANGGGGGGGPKQCADGIDNDGDGLTDSEDPGCHTDYNPYNPSSYDDTLDDESAVGTTQCSDGVDNDSDGQADMADPGCHTDHNPYNDSSYDPDLDDESAVGTTQCSDGVDNDGDDKVDAADPGCHSDFDASNNASFDPTRGDESAAPSESTTPVGGSAPSGGGGGGGGGAIGNGPIVNSYGVVNGTVLGTSTAATGTIATSPTESCDWYLTAFIRVGQQNPPEQVKRLQTVLHNFEGANLEINGVYDAATIAAVNAFQAKYASEVLTPWGISAPTGYVYLTTRKKINEVFCHNTVQFPLTQQQLDEIARVRALSTEWAPIAPTTPEAPATPAAPSIGQSAPAAPWVNTATATSTATAGAEGSSRSFWNFVDFIRNLIPR